jgi:NIMA (never in mitosis gene a)-related kinase 1/4/5
MAAAISEMKDYTLKEPIGRGSFGDAYVVVHKATGAKYVLKQVRLARQREWERKASHLEMQLANELAHPFIVPHFESRLDRGHTIQMVHEYCEGGDLGTHLKNTKVRSIHMRLFVNIVARLVCLARCVPG